jgi:hypothetical protein
MTPQRSYLPIFFGACLSVVSIACDGPMDEEDENSQGQTFGEMVSGSGGSANGESLQVTELNHVKNTLAPGSLILDGVALQEGDPCASSDGLFDCQPELLKLYVTMSKNMVAMITNMYAGVESDILKYLPIGTGSFPIDDGGDMIKLDYNITSVDQYTLVGFTKLGPALHVDFERTEETSAYLLRFDGTAQASENDDTKIEVSIKYRTEQDFDVDILMAGSECDPNDVRSPSTINISSSYSDGLWKGKSQLYMPLWLFSGDSINCSSTPTDATKMFFYTDFVGDNSNTTASIYLANKDLTDVANFENYEGSDFCTNYSDSCYQGYGFGDSNPISTYSNAFCVSTDSETVWGQSCSGLAVEQYLPASGWHLPADLELKQVVLPTDIAE